MIVRVQTPLEQSLGASGVMANSRRDWEFKTPQQVGNAVPTFMAVAVASPPSAVPIVQLRLPPPPTPLSQRCAHSRRRRRRTLRLCCCHRCSACRHCRCRCCRCCCARPRCCCHRHFCGAHHPHLPHQIHRLPRPCHAHCNPYWVPRCQSVASRPAARHRSREPPGSPPRPPRCFGHLCDTTAFSLSCQGWCPGHRCKAKHMLMRDMYGRTGTS